MIRSRRAARAARAGQDAAVPAAPLPELDLWELAREMVVTPPGEDVTTTADERERRRRRRTGWAWVAGGLVVAATGFVLSGVLSGAVTTPAFLVVGIVGLVVGISAFVGQLRARAYRALTVRMTRVLGVVWWITTLAAMLVAVLAAGSAVLLAVAELLLTDEEMLVDAAEEAKWGIFWIAVLGLLGSVVSSALMPPLLTAGDRPRTFKNHWSQLAWTLGAAGVVVCIGTLLLWPGQEAWASQTIFTTGFAALAALFAWHARALSNLRAEREMLLTRLRDTLRVFPPAASGGSAPAPDATDRLDALLALENAVVRGPFRSQSPAAPPPAAGWEIVQIVRLLRAAAGDGEIPTSIQRRALLEGELGDPFRDVVGAPPAAVLGAGHAFLRHALDWVVADEGVSW